MYRNALPQLSGEVFLTDSGLETDLIFNEGFDLPEFASFVLVDDARGRGALAMYFRRHADIAVQHGCGVILEAPTWRASRDWGARIGYPAADLRRVNESAVALLSQVRSEYRNAAAASPVVVVSGCIGPRTDGYRPAERMGEGEAEDYHSEQIAILAATEADLVHAMTITYAAEAIGIARAAAGAGLPAVISFTTETDGRLPDGTPLADAVAAVDAATRGSPAYYGVNCSHPSHFAAALPGDPLGARLRSIRANASRLSHAELDESPALDAGDPVELANDYLRLHAEHPSISILGGCCGTDARHVQAIAEAFLPATTALQACHRRGASMYSDAVRAWLWACNDKAMNGRRFQVRITEDASGRAVIAVPFDPDAAWGVKAVHHVRGTVNGCPLRATLTPGANGWAFTLNPARVAMGLAPGADAAVELEPEGPQRGDLAEDFAAALAADPAAGAFFDTLAQFYRKAYLRYIDATKRRPDLRAERIAEVTGLLADGMKERPRPQAQSE
jgi:homocysteine S-methyltransferase